MAIATQRLAPGPSATILALVAADGTAAAAHARSLSLNTASLRDVADAVHALCVIHGAVPGIVDHALSTCTDEVIRAWLVRTVEVAADERAMLARLTAAVGPLPSTPGQAASEAAILAQRHALEMLARSDRTGCASGAAIAFVLDWAAVRRILELCAARIGIAAPGDFAPLIAETEAMLADLTVSPASERAMAFGAQQMLAQHRGLWHLLEARASARSEM